MACTSAAATLPLAFVQLHSLSHPQLFIAKLPTNPIPLSSSSTSIRTSNYKRVSAKAVSTGPQNTLLEDTQNTPSSSKLVLVVGASGGVGQLVVASLLQRHIKSRLILRDPEKATALFGEQDEERLQVFKGDTRKQDDLDPSMFEVSPSRESHM